LFAGQLASSDGDLRRLIATAPPAATQLSGLLKDTNPGLPILLANLLTTAQVFDTRTDGLRQLLVTLPKAVAATEGAITAAGGRLGLVLTFNAPPPCTEGYQGTPRRPSTDTAPLMFNTAAACTLPHGNPSSVRGAQNAPHPAVPPAAVPGLTLP